MHNLGKVLAFLVIVAAAGSTVLTAKLIQVRNSWTLKTQTFQSSYARMSEDAAKSRAEFAELRDTIETALREWGLAWTVATQIANPAEGRLQINAGTNAGLAEQQVIHGFQLLADGSSIYRGPFVVATAQADRSIVVPNWRLRADDIQGSATVPAWQGGEWRWRSVVPSAYSDRFDSQLLAFTKADETLAERQQTLALQQRLLADAQRQVEYRTAELMGGTQLPQDDALSPEFREGLVAPLKATENERNGVLVAIAKLREAVRQERDAVEQLQAENLELARQLPAPQAALTDRKADQPAGQ